jgi:ATP synthase protein I
MNKQGFKLLGGGLYIGVSIFLGVFVGYLLDKKFDSQPVFVLIGLVVGLIVAFWGFYRMLIPLLKDKTETKDAEKKHERRG